MRARVVIGADGSINVFADEGTLEEASARTLQLFQKLQVTGGVQFDGISQPEQHRHDHQEAHNDAHLHL